MAAAALAQETFCALKSEIERLESLGGSPLAQRARSHAWDEAGNEDRVAAAHIPTGHAPFDMALGGGIPRAALTEIRTELTADNGAASGFALALSRMSMGQADYASRNRLLLWIGDPMGRRESGVLYGPGLAAFGVSPGRILYAAPKNIRDALMIAESALEVASFAAVILEAYGNPRHFGLTESRRLSLRARASGRPLFLLRERGEEESSSATFRLRVSPSRAAPVSFGNGLFYERGIGNPVFRVSIEKSRNPSSSEFTMEWDPHEHVFRQSDFAALAPGKGATDPFPPLSLPVDGSYRPAEMGKVLALPRAS